MAEFLSHAELKRWVSAQCRADSTAGAEQTKGQDALAGWCAIAASPRSTLWVQSGAGKGNLIEGTWDDRRPGTAGRQVCVCCWLVGSSETERRMNPRPQTRSGRESDEVYLFMMYCTVRPESEQNCLNAAWLWASESLGVVGDVLQHRALLWNSLQQFAVHIPICQIQSSVALFKSNSCCMCGTAPAEWRDCGERSAALDVFFSFNYPTCKNWGNDEIKHWKPFRYIWEQKLAAWRTMWAGLLFYVYKLLYSMLCPQP